MKELNEKKWRFFKETLRVIHTVLCVIVTDVLSNEYFNESIITELIIMIIIVIVSQPLYLLVVSVVEQSEFLRKPFEKK